MPCRLDKKTLNTQRATNLVNLLTVHYHSYILDKAVDDLEGLRSGYPSLVQGEPVQPLEYRPDVLISEELLNKVFCIASSQVIQCILPKTDSLGFPPLIRSVANPRAESSSTSILTTISVIASVGGIFV